MLIHPTLEKLRSLKLEGFARGLEEQMSSAEMAGLSFEERLGLLVDREVMDRENQRLAGRLHRAKLRQSACLEDIDFRHPRGLDRSFTRGGAAAAGERGCPGGAELRGPSAGLGG